MMTLMTTASPPWVLADVARGDPLACRAFVHAHQRRVLAVASRMLRPRGLGASVEDVAQETFLRAFKALPRLPATSNVSGYLITICSRLCIDRMRAQGRQRRAFLKIAPAPVVPSPDAAYRGQELSTTLEAALGRLSPEQHAVLVLRVFHDLDYPDIASSLGIRLGTVKSRLSRARAVLRAAIEEGEHVN